MIPEIKTEIRSLQPSDDGKVYFEEDEFLLIYQGFDNKMWKKLESENRDISDIEKEYLSDWEFENMNYTLVESGWKSDDPECNINDVFYAIFEKNTVSLGDYLEDFDD